MYKELNSEAKRGGAEALFALAPLFACLMWWLFAILHFFLSFMFQCLVDLAIDQKQFKISQIQVVYSQTVKYTGINRTSDVKNVYTSKLYVYIQIWSP